MHQDTASLAMKALENEKSVSTQTILEQIDEHDWQEKFQQQFSAIHYGSDLWVYPSWQDNPAPEGIALQLDPGLAFGTGQHPTTHLCMQWLAHAPLRGHSIIDYGCGSGILALAAARLGANHVYAVDIDPQAVTATNSNIVRNHLDPNKFTVGEPDVIQGVRANIIIANILLAPLTELRDLFRKLVINSGTLVLSGILSTQAQKLIDHYAIQFEHIQTIELQDWACVTLRRIQ